MKGKGAALHFDPRTKLFVVLMCSVLTFLANGSGLPVLFALMAGYLLMQGMYRKTLKFLLGFSILLGLQYVIYACLTGAAAIFGFIVSLLVRFIPVVMAASALSAAAPGELIAAMQKLHIPKPIIITLAVGLRFMPCISREYAAIRDAMRMRGISFASLHTVSHPATTMECTLVPLLMRSMKISDELAASAFTKGIDSPGRRTCLRQLRFDWADGMALALFGAAGILICLFFT